MKKMIAIVLTTMIFQVVGAGADTSFSPNLDWSWKPVNDGRAVVTNLNMIDCINAGNTKRERGDRFKRFNFAFWDSEFGEIRQGSSCDVVDYNDGDIWLYLGKEGYDHTWKLYQFWEPLYGINMAKIRWRIWAASPNAVYVYRWNHVNNRFVLIGDSSADQGKLESIDFSDSDNWFGPDGRLFLLFHSQTIPGGTWMKSDALWLNYTGY